MMFKKYFSYTIAGSATSYFLYRYIREKTIREQASIFKRKPLLQWQPPTRKETIQKLKTKKFDLLIIGGGASGAGCALDAVTRGLSVALVEASDFGSETSSKSTKLLHGGIRYLQKAVNTFDLAQLKLVHEALKERKAVIDIAPYLTHKMPIMLPVYNKISVPYYWIGMKMYDWISGTKSLGHSFFLNKEKTIERFPIIKKENLQGSIVYYDGQFNDARLNLMVSLTASYYGASVMNYVKVNDLVKEHGYVKGAICTDTLTGETFKIKSKGVINATGPFIDKIRAKENGKCKEFVTPSSGVHIVLPREFAPRRMGLVIPGTSDGRILFFIPWQGKALIGTTDNKCKVQNNPKPSKEDLNFILDEVKENITYPEILSRKNLLSAWSGIRPLVRNPNDDKTESIVRRHLIHVSQNRLITLSGGKWTTYRRMAEETIDKAIKEFNFTVKRNCVTKYVRILGAHDYDQDYYLRIMRDLNLPVDIAKHLSSTYGDRAYKLREYLQKKSKKLSENYSFIEEEILYCIDNEMAVKLTDVIARRINLGFIDVLEASKNVFKVSKIMKKHLNWSEKIRKKEVLNALEYLETLGLSFVEQK
ncbi:mitochondrial glycerol-3-phosphate dehydrogenase [Conglomerata obtusa]